MSARRKPSVSFVDCEICHRAVGSKGYPNHLHACRQAHEDANKGPVERAAPVERHITSTQQNIARGPSPDVTADTVQPDVVDMDVDEPADPGPGPITPDPDTAGPSTAGAALPAAGTDASGAWTSPDWGPYLPDVYILIEHHPNSGLPNKIISLEGTSSSASYAPRSRVTPGLNPWAPFRSYADFTFAEKAVRSRWSNSEVDDILKSLHGEWTSPSESNVSFKSHRDLEESLAAARKFTVEFSTGSVSQPYKGQMREFTFPYRDPWAWMLSLLQDPTLARDTTLFSSKKYFCDRTRGIKERLYDEPWTGDIWNEIDDALRQAREGTTDTLPHCYAPILAWLDKTGVSETVKMHPILGRALFLPEEIRNASGNGGGVLFGWMPIVVDFDDPDNSGSGDDDFGVFKRTVYQMVLDFIFRTLAQRSWDGEAIYCSDTVPRVIFPGILIVSLDAEEAAIFCACKSHNANIPCPKCLVRKEDLSKITMSWESRTSSSMRAALETARAADSRTARERLLASSGLHDVEHFLWKFARSDPYTAYSYDMLHSDELGKWAHHLWVLLKTAIRDEGWTAKASDNMAKFPRWRGLKHFFKVMEIAFADGQKHLDVMKSILPTVVQLLPRNSALIHCIRAYIKFRILVGCHCMSESRLAALRTFIASYESYCKEVSRKHGKSFNFIKQHQVSHVPDDIQSKGVTSNYVTRPGEGFQQEVKLMYHRTNFRDAEIQMARSDDNAEAIAAIRMTVDIAEEERKAAAGAANTETAPEQDESEDDDSDETSSANGDGTWQLGAGERRWVHVNPFSQLHPPLLAIAFETELRAFLITEFPSLAAKCTGSLQIEEHHCVYVDFQSQDDYRAGRDILRCTEKWYRRPRHDCIMLQDGDEHNFARLRYVLRCKLMDNDIVDVAVVTSFVAATWKPKTFWDGCRVVDESQRLSFVAMRDVVRGACLCPVFQGPEGRPRLHYVIDTIDEDMFLRLNKL